MARKIERDDIREDDPEWVRRHREELERLSSGRRGDDWVDEHRRELDQMTASSAPRVGAGGALPPGSREILEREGRGAGLPPWVRHQERSDPFAFLDPAGKAIEAATGKASEVLAQAADAPVIGGALQGIAAAYGETVDPVLGLVHKTAAGKDSAAERAYQEQRKTLEGDDASPLDFFATTRGLRAARKASSDEARAVASDASRHPVERAMAGAQVGADVIADLAIDLPGAGTAAKAAKAGVRGAVGTVRRGTTATRKGADAVDEAAPGGVADTQTTVSDKTPAAAAPAPASVEPSGEVVDLSEALTRARQNKQRRMEQTAQRVLNREGVSAEQAEELLDFLRSELPDQAPAYERALKPILDAEAEAKRTRMDLRAAEREARITERDLHGVTRTVDGQEVRAGGAEKALERADEALREAQQKADDLARKIDEHEAAALDRIEVARLAGEGRIDQVEARRLAKVFAQLDEARAAEGLPPDVRVKVITSITKEDAKKAAQTGYFGVPDRDVLAKASLNTGKMDDPFAINELAEAVRRQPEKFEAATAPVSLTEMVRRAAQVTGMDDDAMLARISRMGLERGEASRFLYAANVRLEQLAGEYAEMIRSGANEAALDAFDAKFVRFAASVGGADSEAGRLLNALKVKRGQPVIEAIRTRNVIASAKGRVDASEKALRRAEELSHRYAEEARAARDAAENAANERTQRVMAQYAEQRAKRAAEAQQDVAKKQAAYDEAKAAHQTAVDRAGDAAEKAQAAALKASVKHGLDGEVRKYIASLDPSDHEAILSAMRSMTKLSKGERFIAWVTNNAYSGISAQEQNAIGGALRAADHVVTTAIAARTTGPLIARITGAAQPFVAGETKELLAGVVLAARQAPQVWADVMLKGVTDKAVLSAHDLRARAFPGKRGLLFEGFLRLNGSFDSVARHFANLTEQKMLYLRTARRELGPGASDAAVAKRVAELEVDPPTWLLDEAGRAASAITYGGKLGGFAERLMSVINYRIPTPVLGPTPWLRGVVLASRFMYAATAFSLETSGGGIARMVYLARKGPEFHREAARSGVRGAVGAGLLAGGYALYGEGLLMGKDPEGRGREDSVLINGQWVPLGPLWPLSAPLIYAARSADAAREAQEAGDPLPLLIAKGAVGVGKAVANQPVLRTTHDIYQALNRGGEYAERLAATIAQRFTVPAFAFQRDLGRLFDSVQRDPDSFWDAFAKDILWLRDGLAPELDRWGRPKNLRGPQGAARLNPFAVAEEDSDPVEKEVRRLEGLHLREIGFVGDLNIVDLSEDQTRRYRQMAGQASHAAVADLMRLANYGQWNDRRRADEISKTVEAARLRAKRAFADELLRSGDPAAQAKGIAIGVRTVKSNYERAKLVEAFLPYVDKDPALAAALRSELRGMIRGPVVQVQLSGVVDGDTVRLAVPASVRPEGHGDTYRLAGVDVPERNTAAGKRAAEELSKFLAGKKLTIQTEGSDSLGRYLIALKADGVDVSEWLVQSGLGTGRPIREGGDYDLDTYRRVIPLLRHVEQMPRFADKTGKAIGDPKTWAEYDRQRPLHEEYKKKHGLWAADRQYPTVAFYRRIVPQNPARTELLKSAAKDGIPLDKFLPPRIGDDDE